MALHVAESSDGRTMEIDDTSSMFASLSASPDWTVKPVKPVKAPKA